MDVEIQKKDIKRMPKNIVLIGLMIFILLMLAIAGQITYTVLKSDKVYNGVFIGPHNVSGLTQDQLTDFLDKNYLDKAKSAEILVKAKDAKETIAFSQIKIKYDISSSVKKAFEVGRKGNLFDRLTDIVKSSTSPVELAVDYSFDKDATQNIIKSLYDKTYTPIKEADIQISNDEVILISGHPGESIEAEKLLNQVEDMIGACQGGNVDVPVVAPAPKKMDLEELYKKISADASDARPVVVNNSVTITPHVVGRNIDKSALSNIVQDLEKTESAQKVLPVEFVQPKITTEMVQAKLFKDTLGTMNTYFSTGTQNDANRGVNIKLAVSKLTGTIIAPGQTFSFNEVVGSRSEANGYKTAHTYVAGEIVDGVGGGICQVSTTLYNAALFSDMDVVARTNHMFTVGYVPYGRDASVYYPDVDLKFKNNTNWPVKIEGWVTKGNQLFFSIIGTNETPGKTVVISPQIVKTLEPPPVKYVDDPTLPVGAEKIEHEAMKGFVVDTYKTVKLDGKVTAEGKLHRSTYNPLEKLIKRGTKKYPNAPVQQAAPTKPGVDEAANPPAKPVQ